MFDLRRLAFASAFAGMGLISFPVSGAEKHKAECPFETSLVSLYWQDADGPGRDEIMSLDVEPAQFPPKKLPPHKQGSHLSYTGFYDKRLFNGPVPDVVAVCEQANLPGEKFPSREPVTISIPRDATACFEYPQPSRTRPSRFWCD